MEQLIERLKEIAKQNPHGFTAGWSVALKETQNSFGDAGLKKVIAVTTEKTGIVGGWREDGKLWWDAVQIFDNEDAATAAGIENEQIAIYSIDQNRVKFL